MAELSADQGVIIDGLYGNWHAAGSRIKVVDYNDDGRDDLLLGPDGSGKWYFLRNNGGSFSNTGALITGEYGNWHSAGDRIRIIDYDSDGKEDILLGPESNGKWYGLRNNGGTFFSDQGTIINGLYGNWHTAGSRIKTTDYNGDSIEDILLGPDGSGRWFILQNNNGNFNNLAFVSVGEYGNWSSAGNRVRIIDYDADGIEDVLIGPDGSGRWYGLNRAVPAAAVITPVPDTIVDSELRKCIDKNKQLSGVLYDSELTELYCTGNGTPSGPYWISNLSGIGNLTNLERFAFGGNNVSDLSPIGNLFNLQWLMTVTYQFSNLLDDNDFNSIRHLNNLTYLSVGSNPPNMLLNGSAFISGFLGLQEINIISLSSVDCSLLINIQSRNPTTVLSGDVIGNVLCFNP